MGSGSLAGKTAVVTGAGRGIGRAVALALAKEGAAVALAARSAGEIEAVAREATSFAARTLSVRCDVADERQVAELAAQVGRELGPADILVNNAGFASAAPLPKISIAEWNRLLAVNATGTFLCTRAFLPGMLERGWGRIVNVASVAGLTGGKYIAAYAAAKHAVVGLTRAAAAEVAARGVTVNAVCPGYVDTEMTRESVLRIVEKTGRSEQEALRLLLETTPQHRLIEPEEVARAVTNLLDEAARGINGQTIVIDGGALLA